MMGGGGEGGQLHIEPFVHIEREENEEEGEKMNNVDEGNLGAHAQTEMVLMFDTCSLCCCW